MGGGRVNPDTYIFTIDARNRLACLACPLPDCIYCLPDPAPELRRFCPVWLRENARQQPHIAAYKAREKAKRLTQPLEGGGKP